MMSGEKLTARFSMLIVVALACYPLVAYFGLRHYGATWIAACLLVLSAGRLLASRERATPGGKGALLICGGGMLLGLIGVVRRSPDAVLLYPALVNAILLAVFAYSLAYPPSAIERIARVKGDELSPAGVVYTRKVTVVWTIFFLLNGGAALYTALYASMESWAMYNGLVAYALIGALLVGERITRAFLLRGQRS
jgi:uncharacterized membrane protein